MEILYLLIPLALVLVGVIIWFFLWSIRAGQFDDLEGPAHRIVMEDDDAVPTKVPPQADAKQPPDSETSR